ncbi:MAG: sulfite oxidase [Acidimicrobiia bacterium]
MHEKASPTPRSVRLQERLAGVLAAVVALSVTTLVDAVSDTVPSLVSTVAQAVIRVVPGVLSRFAIEAVGTADKPLLVIGTVVVSLLIGGALGPAARRRPWLGPVVFALFGLVGVVSAASLVGVSVLGAAVGAAFGAAAGAFALRALLRALDADIARRRAEASDGPSYRLPGSAVSRRRFLTVGSAATGGVVVAMTTGWGLRRQSMAEAQRALVQLPTVTGGAATPASGTAGLDIAGISPLVTPNRIFYRIDEALVVPSVDVTRWRLELTGMVDRPFELTYDELLGLPMVERPITLSCVSNEVGGRLVGTAVWQGVPLRDLLDRAGVQPGAAQLVGRSVDGFTVGFPTAAALDGRDALVAVGMNGEPLPLDHGFPARLVVPGLYGYVSATKWLKEIELTTWEAFDAYWVERNWAELGPVKVQSRIDVPRDYGRAQAGRQAIAGVAWAPNRGIARVEVSVDGGAWQTARLGQELADDAWRQWALDWDATPGNHTVTVRATTADGEVQTEVKRSPFPDGATGHHTIDVRVV